MALLSSLKCRAIGLDRSMLADSSQRVEVVKAQVLGGLLARPQRQVSVLPYKRRLGRNLRHPAGLEVHCNPSAQAAQHQIAQGLDPPAMALRGCVLLPPSAVMFLGLELEAMRLRAGEIMTWIEPFA